MTKIRKAVIPAAGYGLSFLPATKAQPKELLPIVDKPIIQFIVEEALESGIEEIMIVTGRHKRSIEDHFDSNPELEENLEAKGKQELLDIVRSTTKANLFFVRQAYPKGLGDAINHAKAFVDNEPFVVMLGDNILRSEVPVTKQLMDLYDRRNVSSVAVMEVDEKSTSRYGIADIDQALDEKNGIYNVKQFVEKPDAGTAPSNLAIAGRYILRPEIFNVLDGLAPGVENEIQLTDAINELNQTQRVFAKKITDGTRYDVGDLFGYMDMSVRYGLEHPETKDQLAQYLIILSQQLKK